MNILVFNCGSSSLTYKLFEVEGARDAKVILSGKAHRVGVKGKEPSFIEHYFQKQVHKDTTSIRSHNQAAVLILRHINENGISIDYIGHRFVNGGAHFNKSVFIEKDVLKKLYLCLPLAPIHNPVILEVIQECAKKFPHIKQYVTFDTAFHSSIPYYAYTYALPKKIIQKFGFRKYGFHGLSYSYIAKIVPKILRDPSNKIKIVACHLGTGGSSVAAIDGGVSIDNSMGYSPLPGHIMSTRCGDIDPMLAIYLMATYGYRPDYLMNMLNKESGLLGISGFSSDIRDIIHRITKEGEQASLALDMYIHRLKKYIGSYIAILGGIDALVFTDDIGLRSPIIREKVCENMEWCGIDLDERLNRKAVGATISILNTKRSQVSVVSLPTEEELAICLEGLKLLRSKK
ncbi:MAG: acetate/propionate family kinase [Candidatus Omnitrophica bacterium]|nr:acetate/propionate family kinase [Candidatus Omnitrophota bacterium]